MNQVFSHSLFTWLQFSIIIVLKFYIEYLQQDDKKMASTSIISSSVYKLKFLGTGTSVGIPMVGCHCTVCLSAHPKNQRLRCSVVIETPKGKKILIDATPDLRTQFLRSKIETLDMVFITHDHADHVHGLDDLRPLTFFNGRKPIPTYSSPETADSLKARFPYIFQRDIVFKDRPILGGHIPLLDLHVLPINEEKILQAHIGGEEFSFFQMPHGHTKTLGIFFASMAYLIDCHEVPEPVLEFLHQQKLKVLIIDCLKRTPHTTHLHLEKSLSYIHKICPEKAFFTHLSHDFDHEQLTQELYEKGYSHVIPAYDDLEVDF